MAVYSLFKELLGFHFVVWEHFGGESEEGSGGDVEEMAERVQVYRDRRDNKVQFVIDA